MTGTFLVQHIRDGKVIEQFECENEIVTDGVDAIVDYQRGPVARVIFPTPIEVWRDDQVRTTGFDRASGDSICTCGKLYFDHPYTDHVDYDGRPFLKRLCDGRIVKL